LAMEFSLFLLKVCLFSMCSCFFFFRSFK
jgi:hypothetical protein